MFFCLPFGHALALNFVVCPPVILAILFASFSLLFVRQKDVFFSVSDFSLLGLWFLLSSSFGLGSMSQTAVNHWIAYTVFLIVVYLGVGRAVNGLVENRPDFFFKITGMITFMLFFSCVYAIADWAFFLTTGSEIPMLRPEGGGNGMAAGYVRCRGFSGEPSGLANFILLWSPLAFWHLFSKHGSVIRKTIFLCVVCVAFFATFSTKGILTLASSLPFVLLFFAIKNGINPVRIMGVTLLAVVVVAIVVLSGLGDVLYEAIAPKFFGSEIYEARMSRGADVVNYIEGGHWIVGYGPASYVALVGRDGDTFLSGFAYLLGDSGILGMALFSLFLVSQLFFVRNLPSSGLKVVFTLTLYYVTTGEIIAPIHYSVGFYLVVILLHVAVRNQSRVWQKSLQDSVRNKAVFPSNPSRSFNNQ